MADRGQLERWAKEHDRAMLAVAARYAGPSTTAEDIRQSALLAVLQKLEESGRCPLRRDCCWGTSRTWAGIT